MIKYCQTYPFSVIIITIILGEFINMERMLILLKPDAYKRKLLGKIITRIEDKNFTITAMKMTTMSKKLASEHYAHLTKLDFYPEIESYITSAPVVAMIVEGENVIQIMRTVMGKTRWNEALPGTIRGDYANETTENLIHGSDSAENAEIEIKRFFKELG